MNYFFTLSAFSAFICLFATPSIAGKSAKEQRPLLSNENFQKTRITFPKTANPDENLPFKSITFDYDEDGFEMVSLSLFALYERPGKFRKSQLKSKCKVTKTAIIDQQKEGTILTIHKNNPLIGYEANAYTLALSTILPFPLVVGELSIDPNQLEKTNIQITLRKKQLPTFKEFFDEEDRT